METKQVVRTNTRNHLAQFLREHDRQICSSTLSQNLHSVLNPVGTWALFYPKEDEPDLQFLFQLCPHHQWALPKVNGDELQFFKLAEASFENLQPGAFGLQEPDPKASQMIDTHELKGMVIPGLAFDRRGFRLGRGRGFYDRALEHFEGCRVGVGFSVQITEESLPTEPHDQSLDWVVTEKEVIGPVGKTRVKKG